MGPALVKPIALERANLLRIRDGRGTRIRVARGVVWVTEEDGHEDHVLQAGDAIELARKGMAIAFAHQAARIVIEVPGGVAPPRAIEKACAEGQPGSSIALCVPTAFGCGHG